MAFPRFLSPGSWRISISHNTHVGQFWGARTGGACFNSQNVYKGCLLTNATIEINDWAFGSLSFDQQRGLIAHEIGHVVGLHHTAQYSYSIMKYTTVQSQLGPTGYDIDSYRFLYPYQYGESM